jgi:hypothetical protein
VQNLSRRNLLAAIPSLAASSLGAAGIDRSIVGRHDEAVERYVRQQVTDAGSRWVGGVSDSTGLHHPGAAGGVLTACATAFLQPASTFYKAPLMLERARLAAKFLERSQTPDGNLDLLVTNFNSPPDTGFVAHGVGSAACLAQRAGSRELLAAIEPFLTRAGAALARGGVHTPNHRWVVCSAMAQIHEVFPNPAYPRRIDQWLAEGVDIDADGQYTERSTGVYNTVCDRAFVVLASKLKRPELLDPVRRNLDSMMYLLHPGYEVVTEISRRQDQYDRKDMSGYWFPLQYLALKDRNGRYGAIARHFAPVAASLTTLMEYPELLAEAPTAAVPDDYEKLFPALKVARVRRGAASATILLEDDSHFFSFRRGGAVIASLRFASAFFGKGQFVPSRGAKRGAAYELTQSLEGPYYQPLDPPERVKAGEWGATRARRKRTEVCKLTQSASIAEGKGGFRLRLRAQGTPNVPVAVEIALREGGKLEGCEAAPGGHILASGQATYRVGGDLVRFGPGLKEHSYTAVRGAQPAAPGLRVYLCGFTPFDHTIEIG